MVRRLLVVVMVAATGAHHGHHHGMRLVGWPAHWHGAAAVARRHRLLAAEMAVGRRVGMERGAVGRGLQHPLRRRRVRPAVVKRLKRARREWRRWPLVLLLQRLQKLRRRRWVCPQKRRQRAAPAPTPTQAGSRATGHRASHDGRSATGSSRGSNVGSGHSGSSGSRCRRDDGFPPLLRRVLVVVNASMETRGAAYARDACRW